jgi:hypothetical protein
LEKLGYLKKVQENPNIILDEPLGYLEFTCLMANCKYLVTDSGGLQEESTSLDIPCFTLRENTERPSTLIENNGTNQLIHKISEIKIENNILVMGTCRVNFIDKNLIYNPIFYSCSAIDVKEQFEIMFENKKILNMKETPYFGLNTDYNNFIGLPKPENKVFIIEICSLKSLKYNDNIVPYKCLNDNINVEEIKLTTDDTFEILTSIIEKYPNNIFIFIPPFINDEVRNIQKMFTERKKIKEVLIKICENNYNCSILPYDESIKLQGDIYHFDKDEIEIHFTKIIKYLQKIKKEITLISLNASTEIKNIITSIYNKIYMPLGYGCGNTKNELSVINTYLNYEDEIEFHNNISELLKLISIYPEYEDYIYMEIGKLYKNFMKSYSTLSLRYFEKALKIKNGKVNYDAKLCYYYENSIYSSSKEKALLKIDSTNFNDIKLFYKSMYKYVNNIDTFEEELKLFIKSGKKIYQSIPLSTYTFTDEIIKNNITIEEYKLEEILFKDMNLIVTSCDTNYFNLYGKYIIESFLKNNNDEILIIDIINNKIITPCIEKTIHNYNKNKNIIIKIKNVNVKNVKAYSSTLRFIRAYLLKDNKRLVIDLDSVILKSLNALFIDLNKYDIGSRILEKTYPWQMYTAGFCFFNNTKNSNKVLIDMYNCLNNKMIFDSELWWIDQNALEYGIRNNKNILSIKNYFGIKDNYIISPTGNTEHKLKTLKNLI